MSLMNEILKGLKLIYKPVVFMVVSCCLLNSRMLFQVASPINRTSAYRVQIRNLVPLPSHPIHSCISQPCPTCAIPTTSTSFLPAKRRTDFLNKSVEHAKEQFSSKNRTVEVLADKSNNSIRKNPWCAYEMEIIFPPSGMMLGEGGPKGVHYGICTNSQRNYFSMDRFKTQYL